MEMVYHRQLDAALDPRVQFMGISLDTQSMADWVTVSVLTFASAGVALAWRLGWRGRGRGAALAEKQRPGRRQA
jgi:hypothetical protein